MRKEVKVRSVFAKALENPIFRLRVVVPKKGKGSYKRSKNKIAA